MSYLSVSTWSLHRLLGPLRWTVWDEEAGSHRTREQEQPQVLTLLELPAEAGARGYKAVEICHFHFPSTDSAYLQLLRNRFETAGVSFDTLLLDYGDLSTRDEKRREADYRLVQEWIEVAAQAGAKQIRVIAGDASPEDKEALYRSAASLSELHEYAAKRGVSVITENFKPLMSRADNCLELLDRTNHQVRMITDFGNFAAPAKYGEFALTLPHSLSVHAKAHYDEAGMPDEPEFRRCLDTLHAAGYNGSVVLIYDGPGDMWEGLARIQRIVEPYL
ncbi:sugar phosphate isomerase/epimerase [Paenibacillus doosanensis]|uniref:Xylose isomerase-like TIM barrel n=1 Tax=Paenibacillus konkukensis TaxID=2020716 RepID=A0ABY4RHI6_9BACL|nr:MULTISPECIES: TIM barrel protein [Paenibacillus]MCS7462301.1 sugar phosphate isomerase/epimerase [Paenibacillus doosanensis]UQZ80887.1 Xylose isomerase-like TIM barrel [Paenibacillus konkukensis]